MCTDSNTSNNTYGPPRLNAWTLSSPLSLRPISTYIRISHFAFRISHSNLLFPVRIQTLAHRKTLAYGLGTMSSHPKCEVRVQWPISICTRTSYFGWELIVPSPYANVLRCASVWMRTGNNRFACKMRNAKCECKWKWALRIAGSKESISWSVPPYMNVGLSHLYPFEIPLHSRMQSSFPESDSEG